MKILTNPKEEEKEKNTVTNTKKLFLIYQEPLVQSTQGLECCGISVGFIRPFSDNEYTLECATIGNG